MMMPGVETGSVLPPVLGGRLVPSLPPGPTMALPCWRPGLGEGSQGLPEISQNSPMSASGTEWGGRGGWGTSSTFFTCR